MSKWLPKPLESRIAFYLPSNIKGTVMPAGQRQQIIDSTMAFLVVNLGGGTQIEALGSFENGGKVVSEEVTICYAFLSKEDVKKHEKEINQIANALAIEFKQDSIAIEVNRNFYLFEPNEKYRRNYERDMEKAKARGTEWGYQKWLKVAIPKESIASFSEFAGS